MFKALGDFRATSSKPSFLSANQIEKNNTEDILIQDRLLVRFDHQRGETLEVSAIKPTNCAPFYRINPKNMGASEWYSIEYTPLIENTGNASFIIAVLDAASARSATVFVIFRIFYVDGRSEDISSRQIEIRKKRNSRAFWINTHDAESFTDSNIKYCRLIFFVEARNVSLDIYGLSITSATTASCEHDEKKTKRVPSNQNGTSLPLLKRTLSAKSKHLWKTKTRKPLTITENVFIDFEQGLGQEAKITRRDDNLILDFTKTTGHWRTIEFRFNQVKNTGTVFAILHSQGMSLSASPLDVALVLREYDDDCGWTDAPIPFSLTLHSEKNVIQHLIDVSALLKNSHSYHRFGIFLFFPPETGSVAIKELEVSVFDSPTTHS